MSIRTNFSNAFETTLTAEMGPTDLVANVISTSGGPTSPAYLVIDPDDPSKREYILFDGTFGTTTFRTTSTNKRYLADSAAASGITHAEGAVVRMAATRQHFDDLHSRVDTRLASAAHTKAAHTSLGLAEHPHGNEAHTQPFATAADAVPAGVIVGWSGAVNNVPSGWALCNGSSGTPDLRDRFIVGAGGGYNVGATGGVSSVTLTNSQIPSHSHTANSSNDGSHSHASGNLSTDSHAHGSGNLTGGNHSHGSGNYSYAHTHASGNLTGGNHSHGVGTLSSGSTNLNHSHGISLRTTGSTNHDHAVATVTAGAGFTNVGWTTNNTSSGAANLNHNHTLSGATANAGVSVNGNTAGASSTSVGGNSAAGAVSVNGNTSGSTAGVSGNTSAAGAHSHTISVGNTGGGGSHENRPPYFALAFIMKL